MSRVLANESKISLLGKLPPAGAGLKGWPWTEETRAPDGFDAASAPTISIVTPNYNMGAFIERTIRSVLLQNYPKLEYIVMDGGSKDDSVEVIRRYGPWLAHWQSAPDKGQTDAINRGLEKATGQIWAYMNSDDIYLPGAFYSVAERWMRGEWGSRSAGKKLWITGTSVFTDASGRETNRWVPKPPPESRARWLEPWGIPQASSFWDREAFDRFGLFDENYNYVFDTEFEVRLIFNDEFPHLVPDELYAERVVHDAAKSWDKSPFERESERMSEQYEKFLNDHERAEWRRILGWKRIAKKVQAIDGAIKDRKFGSAISLGSQLLSNHPINGTRALLTRLTGFSLQRRRG